MQPIERIWVGQVRANSPTVSLNMLMCKSLVSSTRDSLSYTSVVHNGIQTCPSSSYIADVVG
jgi:hypothetical protein